MRQRLKSPKTERRPDFTDLHNPSLYTIDALATLCHDKFSCHRLKNAGRLKLARPPRIFSPSELQLIRKIILDSYNRTSKNRFLIYKTIKELLRLETIYDRELQVKMWIILSGARESLLTNQGYYSALTQAFPMLPDVFAHQIELDVIRTFPDMAYFATEKARDSLRAVLNAYAKRNGYVGYCQGFNVIVGKMIPFMTEEEAFWLFTSLIENILPLEYYTNMAGAIADLRVLNMLISSMFPDVGRKLREIGMDLSLFTLRWFVCVYASIFNEEMLFPIWDFLFTYGDVALFKVALWLIKRFSADILAARDFTDVLHTFNDKRLAELNDVQGLRQFYNNCYINKKALRVLRSRVLKSVQIEEDDKSRRRKRQTPRRPPTEDFPKWTVCSPEWPICMSRINAFRKAKHSNPFLTLREANFPPIIQNYFGEQPTQPSTCLIGDNREEDETTLSNISSVCQRKDDCDSNLVVFRDIHTCQGPPLATPPSSHIKFGEDDQALSQYMTSSYLNTTANKNPRLSTKSAYSDLSQPTRKDTAKTSPITNYRDNKNPTFVSSVFRLDFNYSSRRDVEERKREDERVHTEEITFENSDSDSENEEAIKIIMHHEARAPYKSSLVYYALGEGRELEGLQDTQALEFARSFAKRYQLFQ
eukprot:TRINITY_DN3864_c0_g1_i3.p1 TRINITY_DN3864_c0_g1~~TRINITY_DN3864_c0_g1_i3.p1  ORF type:complete len:647 (-),score=123.87 TRINITY_DN3864_c0_g1_i3:149-2089(-)